MTLYNFNTQRIPSKQQRKGFFLSPFGDGKRRAVVGLRACRMGSFAFAFRRGEASCCRRLALMLYGDDFSFAYGEDGLSFIVGLPSCRAGSYFRYAAKVTKGAPKGEENPFMAGFLPPLETLIIPAGRGSPPGVARGLTAKWAFGLFARS